MATAELRAAREGYLRARKRFRPGQGGRFKALVRAIRARGGVENPEAVAAAIGRRKYGAKRMAKWAQEGRE